MTLEIRAEPSSQEVFTKIYETQYWGSGADGFGSSGRGSTLESTSLYREFLQNFLATHSIHSVVEIGCGDWEFSRFIDWKGIHYIGYDVVLRLISTNQKKYGTPNIHFIHGDGIHTDLPTADLLLCKDVLHHLPQEDIFFLIPQLKKFKFCLFTNDIGNNHPIKRGGYSGLDLTADPFFLKGTNIFSYNPGLIPKQILLIDNNDL